MIKNGSFQQQIVKIIEKIKKTTYITRSIYGNFQNKPFELVPLTTESVEDKKIIALLATWRDTHQTWFPAQFTVTEQGTKTWLKKGVIDVPDRILFMIKVGKEYVGHVGLYRFEFDRKSAQIDNIVRGSKNYPGIMSAAIETMMEWGRETLGLESYTLETRADNKKAIDLYTRLGFVEVKRSPIVQKKSADRTEWVHAEPGQKAQKYEVLMQLRSPKKISFAGPSITQKEIDAVHEAVTDGFYDTFDMHVKKLEKVVSEYLGMKYVIPTHCCTLALHLACAVLGFTKGDEVICTDFSWVATANAIAYTGATPVFVDIHPDTWCIDPKEIERAITKKTKGIMLVHTFGHPAQMDEIMKIAKKHNLKVIEDAAPSLGAEFKGQKVGTFGDVSCISFHGAKIAVTGEGGVFVTNNKELYEKAALLSQMGRTDSNGPFWCDFLGYQYGMGNLSASLAAAQVERIDELIKIKRQIFAWYEKGLKGCEGIQLIKEQKDCKSNYCYPSFMLDETSRVPRDTVLKLFKALNIHARPGFAPMGQFPHFQKEFKSKQQFANPVTHRAWKQGISLPSAANLNEDDVAYVCNTIKRILYD